MRDYIQWLITVDPLLMLAVCGGPLAIGGALEPAFGSSVAFLIAMTPMVLLHGGAWTIFWDEDFRPSAKFWVYAGGVGAIALTLMNLVAGYLIATGRNRAIDGVVEFGIVAGTIGIVIYARRARAFLRGD